MGGASFFALLTLHAAKGLERKEGCRRRPAGRLKLF
jgi:hypothetical protein